MTVTAQVTLTWHRGFPSSSGMYLVELADGEHIITPYTVPGDEDEDTQGDMRRPGWSCLTHSGARVVAWAKIPKAIGYDMQASVVKA